METPFRLSDRMRHPDHINECIEKVIGLHYVLGNLLKCEETLYDSGLHNNKIMTDFIRIRDYLKDEIEKFEKIIYAC